MKWRSSNEGMNGKGEAGGSDADCNDKVLSSLTTASFSSLIRRKRVKTLGKVAEDCDAIDPPVPRKLRSAINKRVGQTVSLSSRYVKKRRHLSAISAQALFMDHETRLTQSLNSFTTEEEVVADALLSLSQIIPPICSLVADRAMAEDTPKINVASTSCSEGAVREEEKITVLPPNAANKVATEHACTDQTVEITGNVLQANPVPSATCTNKNSHLLKDEKIQELSLGIITDSPSPYKEDSNSSLWKQLKVQFDCSPTHTTKIEASQWLVNSSKPDFEVHDGKKAKNSCAQENVSLVQTPLPCTSHGCLIKPSASSLAAHTNSVTEKANVTANNEKPPLAKNVGPANSRKRSTTHVYVSHLIQMHLDKDKASQSRVKAKPEEKSHSRASRPPNLRKKNRTQDERFYAVHFDARLPVQPPNGGHEVNAASQQKMVQVCGNFLSLPASAASAGAAQHVQYLHPQITPGGAMPYQFPHLPYSRGGLAPAATALQQMTQYMCSAGYQPRPTLPAMKLQQQQQAWQFHFPQYQARPDAAAAPAWQQQSSRLRLQDVPTLRPVVPVLPPPTQVELFCAPYQGGGREPPQLRLI